MESVKAKEKVAKEAAKEFAVPGKILSVEYYPEGNINDTFFVNYSLPDKVERIVLQRVNTTVFTRPDVVMKNMRRVTDHVISKILKEDMEGRWHCPGIVKTKDGKDYFENSIGFWRALTFIDNARTLTKVKTEAQAYQAGSVLGWFHLMVNDIPAKDLGDPLPGYHVPSNYLKKFYAAEKTKLGRERIDENEFSKECYDFIAKRVEFYKSVETGDIRKKLSERVGHGDLKSNNIMVEEETGRGVGLIDLDTVAVRPLFIDFGDMVRSACNSIGEETLDFDKVEFDFGFYKAIIKGYMERAAGFIPEADKNFLPAAGWFLAFEHIVRFFGDHIAGDVYFKINYPGNNLNRAVVQMRLVQSIEAQMDKMCEVLGVKRILKF